MVTRLNSETAQLCTAVGEPRQQEGSNLSFVAIDMVAKLVVLLVKYLSDPLLNKVNLLTKVLNVTVRMIKRDHDRKRGFHPVHTSVCLWHGLWILLHQIPPPIPVTFRYECFTKALCEFFLCYSMISQSSYVTTTSAFVTSFHPLVFKMLNLIVSAFPRNMRLPDPFTSNLKLVNDLDTEGRYLFLNTVVNQLRNPNNHTYYFLCSFLFLFAEASAEIIQEQITRVLLDRLIVNRPHPWGLLTGSLIELIKVR